MIKTTDVQTLSDAELADQYGLADETYQTVKTRRDRLREELLKRIRIAGGNSLLGSVFEIEVDPKEQERLDVTALRNVLSPTALAAYTITRPQNNVYARRIARASNSGRRLPGVQDRPFAS